MTKSIGWVWQFNIKDPSTLDNVILSEEADCSYYKSREIKGKPVQVMLVPERLPESELDVLMSSTDPELQLMAKAFYRLAENHILGDSK